MKDLTQEANNLLGWRVIKDYLYIPNLMTASTKIRGEVKDFIYRSESNTDKGLEYVIEEFEAFLEVIQKASDTQVLGFTHVSTLRYEATIPVALYVWEYEGVYIAESVLIYKGEDINV